MGLFTKIFGTYSDRELKQIYPIVDEIVSKRDDYVKLSDDALIAKTADFKSRLEQGATLDDILPDAFATVREAARRVLGQEPFRVQLVGGVVLHQGRIAEMKTGEGKTLVALLPAYLNALTGKGVHIVTVNDYLAKYGSEWVGKVFRYLGLSVGLIVHGLDKAQRQAAYAADITYGTNNEMGFDYLRDNMARSPDELVQRGHNFAIVDEVDSILIDEARTPLIISGMGEKPTELYDQADKLVRTMKKKVVAETDDKAEEAADEDADYIVDEKTRTATLTSRGIAKAEAYFRLENLSDPENSTIAHHINQAIKAHGVMKIEVDYVIKDGQVIIVDEFTGRLMFGRRYNEGLHQAIEAKENVEVARESKTLATITFQNYFRIYTKLSGMTGTALTEEEEFGSIYKLDVIEIPTNKPMIRQDDHDVVYKTEAAKYRAVVEQVKECHEKNQPVLVGTVSIEKNEYLSRLLKKAGIEHSLLNAKNHESEAEIVAQAGKPGAVTVATNMAGRGTDIILGGNAEYLAKKDLRQFLNKFPEQTDLLKAIIGKDPHKFLQVEELRKLEGRKDPKGFPTREDLLGLLSKDGLRRLLVEKAPRELLIERSPLTEGELRELLSGKALLAGKELREVLSEKELRELLTKKDTLTRDALRTWLYKEGLISSQTQSSLSGWLNENRLSNLPDEVLRELVQEEALLEFLSRKNPNEVLAEVILRGILTEGDLREWLAEEEPLEYLSMESLLALVPRESLRELISETDLLKSLHEKRRIPSRDKNDLLKWLDKNDLHKWLERNNLFRLVSREAMNKWLIEQDPHELLSGEDPLKLLSEKGLLDLLGKKGLLEFLDGEEAGKEELRGFLAGKAPRLVLRNDLRELILPSMELDPGYRRLADELQKLRSRRNKENRKRRKRKKNNWDSRKEKALNKEIYVKKIDEIYSVSTGFAETNSFVIRYVRELFTWYMEKYKLEIEGEADKVRGAGGLFIIGTERHDSRRIDNQLRGRAGRQGDPGESRFYLSLEDDLMRLFGGDRINNLMERLDIDENMPIENKMLTKAIENAQTSVEARNFQVRKNTLEYDDVMNTQREIIYGQRKQVLGGMDTRDLIASMISTLVSDKVHDAFGEAKHLDDDGYRTMIASLEGTFFPKDSVQFTPEEIAAADAEAFIRRFTDEALKTYDAREKEIEALANEIEAEQREMEARQAEAEDEIDEEAEDEADDELDDDYDDELDGYDEIDDASEDVPEISVMRKLEQSTMLRVVDEYWMDHIDAMQDLRQGIRLRAYAQSNPVDAYKNESLHMFEEMVYAIREETVRRLYSMRPMKKWETVPEPAFKNITEGRGDGVVRKRVKQQPRRVQKIGRNDPCPCGSGKKYKNCCGRNA